MHLDRLFHDQKFTNHKLGFIGRPSIHSFATGAPSDNKKEAENIWKHFDSKIIN
jgi:hypothetical protein